MGEEESEEGKEAEEKEEEKEEEGQEERGQAEGEGQGPLRAEVAVAGLGGHRGEEDGVAPGRDESGVEVHQEQEAERGSQISPDGKLAAATKAGSFDMLKLAGLLNKHIK